MQKTTLAAIIFAGISAVLLTDRGIRLVNEKKKQTEDTKISEWTTLYEKSDKIPYQGKWAGADGLISHHWDLIHTDSSLTIGEVYGCYGPNGHKAIIVVTALYGPIAVINNSGLLTYAGHPKLGLIRHDDKAIFTKPIDPTWLGSILDPHSEIYKLGVGDGWETLHETIDEINDIKSTAKSLEGKINALSTELADKIKINAELRLALKLCNSRCESSEPYGYYSETLGTFSVPSFALPIVDATNATITWVDELEVHEEFEEVEIELHDEEAIAAIEEAFKESA